jgi:hypothetical protein
VRTFTVFLFVGVPAVAFVVGLSRLPRWTVVVCPAVELAVWGWARLNVSSSYDQKSVYLVVGAAFAIASAVAWLAGRGLAVYAGWLGRQPPPQHSLATSVAVVAAGVLMVVLFTLLYTGSGP